MFGGMSYRITIEKVVRTITTPNRRDSTTFTIRTDIEPTVRAATGEAQKYSQAQRGRELPLPRSGKSAAAEELADARLCRVVLHRLQLGRRS